MRYSGLRIVSPFNETVARRLSAGSERTASPETIPAPKPAATASLIALRTKAKISHKTTLKGTKRTKPRMYMRGSVRFIAFFSNPR